MGLDLKERKDEVNFSCENQLNFLYFGVWSCQLSGSHYKPCLLGRPKYSG